MSLVRDVDKSHSVMDCLYPRDPPQSVREKKQLAITGEGEISEERTRICNWWNGSFYKVS